MSVQAPTPAGHPAALPIIAGAMARVFAPPEKLVPSSWMGRYLVVPDGPRAGDRWDPQLTPYVAEVVDAMGPDSAHNIVAVRKSAQTGVSVAAIGIVLAYVDKAPCRIGYALPTIDALQEFNREKLGPSIDQTGPIRERIRPQTSRSATGSTTTSKRFPGGSLVLLNANSAPDLRMKTLKIGIADEVDEWAADLDGQGDPWNLFQGRFTAFHSTGDYRILALSTPTVETESRIDALYHRGDQRQWHVRCPQCSEEIVFAFRQLRFERRRPFRAHYVAQCCGGVIEHHEKAALVRAGRFIPTNPDGHHPSFHVDALISQLTTWDKIAEAYVEAEGDERKLKAFHNTVLGLPYTVRGDAPDHVRLFERREDYPVRVIPPLGLLLTCGADVQHDGIWYEVVAWAPDRQSWTVAAGFLAGETTDHGRGAFAALTELYEERFADHFGNRRQIEALMVDAGDGGRANQVYAWCRSRPRAYAIKGVPGWSKPAIGNPTKVQIRLKGAAKPSGTAMLYPVGTWDLKAEFYADLRKDRADVAPAGYCHFGTFLDEAFFRQITAESLVDARMRGRTVRIWRDHGPNHLLDARVYARAGAEQLGLTRKTQDQWAALAQHWRMPIEADDLFAPPAVAVERTAAPAIVAESETLTADFRRTLEGTVAGRPARQPRFARLSGRNRRG